MYPQCLLTQIRRSAHELYAISVPFFLNENPEIMTLRDAKVQFLAHYVSRNWTLCSARHPLVRADRSEQVSLQPADRFALIAFGNSTHALWESLTPCTPANREVARHFAKQLAANMGGTEIGKALPTAYEVLGGDQRGRNPSGDRW